MKKAEIHVHIEGTVAPHTYLKLAARHNIRVPLGFISPTGNYAWQGFTQFLAAYDTVAEVCRTPEDYHDIAYDYLKAAAAEGSIYTEFFNSPEHAKRMGMTYADLMAGMTSGISAAQTDFGIEARIICNSVRHLPDEEMIACAEDAVKMADHPLLVGFGHAGDEKKGHPSEPAVIRCFDMAREAGLRLTCHAGEVCPPDIISATLDHLKVERIGHGVRSVEDPEVIARLKAEDIHLEVCPLSNIATGQYARVQDHPLPLLVEAGLSLSLNSDDPPFFSTSVGTDYTAAQQTFAFSDERMAWFTRQAIERAFCDVETRARLLSKL